MISSKQGGTPKAEQRESKHVMKPSQESGEIQDRSGVETDTSLKPSTRERSIYLSIHLSIHLSVHSISIQST